VGSVEASTVVVESAVETLSGVQGYPSPKMWAAIDPKRSFEYEWNRLGHIRWTLGNGQPTVSNPQPDVIQVTFDSCSAFAQKNVDYVLSDAGEGSQRCLTPVTTVKDGQDAMTIFRVTPSP
jgi:hypothetical protein